MIIVTDIVGPQHPVQTWPPLVTGALRRTSTIDTHPAGTGNSDVGLRARDVLARQPDTLQVLGEVSVRAHLTERVIDDIASATHDARLAQLVGSRVGPGFRSTVGRLFPGEARRAGLLHLLLDDWVGASLVSGYAVQHAAINLGIEEKLPPGTADNMAGICAGFAADASLVPYAKRTAPFRRCKGRSRRRSTRRMHTVEPLRAQGMRRFRRLDLRPVDGFDAHFRDSHVDGNGVETIVHEYTVDGSVDASTRTITSVTRTCGCCRGRNALAPSEVRRESKGWRSQSSAAASVVSSWAPAPARTSTTRCGPSPTSSPPRSRAGL